MSDKNEPSRPTEGISSADGATTPAATVTAPEQLNSPDIAPRLRPGQTFGPYRIERLLGQGGMGEVYEAEHQVQQRRVALKVLSRALDSSEERERFLREGQLAASLSHPNVVYVFGSSEIEGLPTIAMELVSTGTLKDLVRVRGPLPVREAVDKMLQALEGLTAAAGAGIVHRDVKPSNLFVEPDGTTKVGDFGISVSLFADTSRTGSAKVVGTPAFAAPEQLRGEPVDVRADIYAVGVTLFYLLTGRVPFEANNLASLVARVSREAPPSPRTLQRRIPRRLATVILKCLEKDAAARPQGHAALIDLLRPYGSAALVPARWVPRVIAAMVDGLALSVATTLGYVLIQPGSFQSLFGLIFGVSSGMLGPIAITDRSSALDLLLIALPAVVPLLLFVWCEGHFGAGPGKWLCGLRVVHRKLGVPSVPRAFARGVVLWLLIRLPVVLVPLVGRRVLFSVVDLSTLVEIAVWAAILGTARERNGYAWLHEIVSGTRTVVAASVRQGRPARTFSPEPLISAQKFQLGPYLLAVDAASLATPATIRGFDPILRRPVWLHLQEPCAAPVPINRRDLGRITRLRWLNGSRTDALAWDAYEAPGGDSLAAVQFPPDKLRWSVVRPWLRDFAREFEAASSDKTMPELHFTRAWTDREGRGRLLDIPPPASQGEDETTVSVPISPRSFIVDVLALAGQQPDELSPGLVAPPPLAVGRLMSQLDARFVDNPTVLKAVIDEETADPAEISRGARMAQLIALAYFVGVVVVGMVYNFATVLTIAREQELTGVHAVLKALDSVETKAEPAESKALFPRSRVLIEAFIAGRFGHFATRTGWRQQVDLSAEDRARIETIVRNHRPQPLFYALAAISFERSGLVPELPPELRAFGDGEFWQATPLRSWLPIGKAFVVYVAVSLGIVLVICLLTNGLAMRLVRTAVVDRSGRRVTRLRGALRTTVAATPLALFVCGMVVAEQEMFIRYGGGFDPWSSWSIWTSLFGLLTFLIGCASLVLRPERGLLDRAMRTWLVAR